MRRDNDEYERMAKDIIQIYLDYEIKTLPIHLTDICEKLGVEIAAYSSYGIVSKDLLIKKSKKGFFIKGTPENPPTILYNDYGKSIEEMRFTIAHEIKHYVYNEDSDDNDSDDLADSFGRYFLCPIPYLIVKGIVSSEEISTHCIVTSSAANNAALTISNRMKHYETKIFDYEIPLLELLIREDYRKYREKHYNQEQNWWSI